MVRRHSSWCSGVAQSRRSHLSTLAEQAVVPSQSVGRTPDWAALFAYHLQSCHVEVVLVLAAQLVSHWDLRSQCWP